MSTLYDHPSYMTSQDLGSPRGGSYERGGGYLHLARANFHPIALHHTLLPTGCSFEPFSRLTARSRLNYLLSQTFGRAIWSGSTTLRGRRGEGAGGFHTAFPSCIPSAALSSRDLISFFYGGLTHSQFSENLARCHVTDLLFAPPCAISRVGRGGGVF